MLFLVSGQRIYTLKETVNKVRCVTAIMTFPDGKC
jgi:hypothetical protein